MTTKTKTPSDLLVPAGPRGTPLSIEQIEKLRAVARSAKDLLENESFLDVVNYLSEYHAAAIIGCRPGERDRETRDYHHTMHHALSSLVSEIRARIAAGEELERRLEEMQLLSEEEEIFQ